MHGPGGIERRQLQTLSQTGEGVALDGGRAVHPPSEQQVLDQELVWQEAGEVSVLALLLLPLWLLQQNHHHVHGEQPAHHLQKSPQHTVHLWTTDPSALSSSCWTIQQHLTK